MSVLAILLVAFRLPESRAGEQASQDALRASHPFRLLRERRGLRLVAAAALLVTSSQGILESIFAIWALNRFGFGPRTVGIALFGAALVAVVMQGGLVRVLVPRLGEALLGALGALVYAIGLIAVAAAGSSLALVGIGLLLCGAGMGAFNPSASALASRQASASERGAVMGTYQASSSLARVIGPFVSGPIYALVGANAPFLTGACISLPAAWLVWRARKVRARS